MVVHADDRPSYEAGTFADPAVRAKYAQPSGVYYTRFHPDIDTSAARLEHQQCEFVGGSPPSILPF